MSKVVLRVRSKNGTARIDNMLSTSKLSDLQAMIEGASKISKNLQKIKFGYPPKYLNQSNQNATLQELGIKTGETLIIEEGEVVFGKRDILPHQYKDIPQKPTGRIASTDFGVLVRRVIKADNACLFNSVAYGLEGEQSRNNKRADALRRVIADFVMYNPQIYTRAFLGGKTAGEYKKYIMKKETWGGAIECSILSQFYSIQINAFDIQTTKMYSYGEGQGFDKMIMVLYDGIHYDALALNQSDDGSGPESFDITVFSARDEGVKRKGKQLVERLNRQHQFTNLSGFSVKCLQCNMGFKGQKEVQAHHVATGHINFAEIKH